MPRNSLLVVHLIQEQELAEVGSELQKKFSSMTDSVLTSLKRNVAAVVSGRGWVENTLKTKIKMI